MEVWLQHINRARTLQIVVVVVGLGIGLSRSCALADDNNNGYYSIVDDHPMCDHIIPKFIEQIMSHKSHNCDEPGVFPKPGNCSVFFKCAKSGNKIQPFVEYCAVGYNFVNAVCVPNTNSSDCPQYTCRIPDGNEFGNEIHDDSSNNFQSLPLVVTSSTPAVIVEGISSTVSTVEEHVMESNTDNGMDQSEQSMQMTQAQQNSSGKSPAGHYNLIMSLCIFYLYPMFH